MSDVDYLAKTTFDALSMAGWTVHKSMSVGKTREEALQSVSMSFADIEAAMTDTDQGPLARIFGLLRVVGASLGAAWFENAFATIEVDAALAASLACTSIPREYMADIRLPWRCVRIKVPAGVVGDTDSSILILQNKIRNDLVTMTSVGDRNTGGCISLGEEPTLAGFVETADWQWTADTLKNYTPSENDDALARAGAILHQIAAGVCIELATRPVAGPPPARHSVSLRKKGPPTAWVFKLRRSVSVDCRPALLEHIREGRNSIKIQCLVRGHHKRQSHGPNGSLRKWIHIEPYWRGPEDAPIALRSHTIGVGT